MCKGLLVDLFGSLSLFSCVSDLEAFIIATLLDFQHCIPIELHRLN